MSLHFIYIACSVKAQVHTIFAIKTQTSTHNSREDRWGYRGLERRKGQWLVLVLQSKSEVKCSEGRSAFLASLPSIFFFSPSFYSCLIPSSLFLFFFFFLKKNFFPNKQDGIKLCNLQMYEINIIPNEPLGKCSPLNLARDYGGKKKS